MRVAESIYTRLGMALVLGGTGLSLVSFLLLHSIPLTALGISLLVLGAVCLVMGRASPYISPEASSLLLKAGYKNIAAIVEELGLRAKAVYLPSSLCGGEPQALIPLHSNPSLPSISSSLPQRMIVRFGSRPEDMGLLVTTPGSAAVKLLEKRAEDNPEDLENTLASLLAGTLELVDKVKVRAVERGFQIEMTNPRLEYKDMPFYVYDFLGSPLASIVAAVVAESTGKPVGISSEESERRKRIVILEVLR